MTRPKLFGCAAVAAALVLGGLAVAQAQQEPDGTKLAPVASTADNELVTLVTGDQVLVQAHGGFVFRPGKGRADIGYRQMTSEVDGARETYVIPNDAAPLVANGTVDRRLFGIKGLIRDGIAASADLPHNDSVVGAHLEPELYDLTLHAIPRKGSELLLNAAWLNLDTGEGWFVEEWNDNGEFTMRVPPGRYEFFGSIDAEGTKPSTTAFVSDVTVGKGDKKVTWNANKGKKLGVRLDKKDAKTASSIIHMTASAGSRSIGLHSVLSSKGVVYVVPTAKVDSDYRYSRHLTLDSPKSAEAAYRYNLYFDSPDRVPPNGSTRVHDKDLRQEKAVYHSQGVKGTEERGEVPQAPGYGFETPVALSKQAVPGKRTEFYTPAKWAWLSELYTGEFMNEWEAQWRESARPVGTKTVHWNRAPIGPSIELDGVTSNRVNDEFNVIVPMFAGPGLPTIANTDAVKGKMKLSLDGKQIGKADSDCFDNFDLPAGAGGTFTLNCESTRKVAWSKVGVTSSAKWTFHSEPGEPDAQTVLPLQSVRLDASNVTNGFAPVGDKQKVTLTVERQAGAINPGTKNLKFEVSHDGGKTWKKVSIDRDGDKATGTVKHPKGAKTVSVRMSVTDNDGNTATHTSITAYRLK